MQRTRQRFEGALILSCYILMIGRGDTLLQCNSGFVFSGLVQVKVNSKSLMCVILHVISLVNRKFSVL